MRALLLAAILAPVLAWAQTSEESRWPQLRIYSQDPTLLALINNGQGVEESGFAIPPYALPDSVPDAPVYLLIGTSVFQRVTPAGDTVSAGVAPTLGGVTADVELALDANGEPALGCATESGAGTDIANSLAGRIGLVARGRCAFIHKVAHACRAGAHAVIVYNPADRVPDTVTHMGASVGYRRDAVTIPAALLPWSLARPLVEARQAGTPVEARLQAESFGDECYDPAPLPGEDPCPPMPPPTSCGITVAAEEDAPSEDAGFALRLAGPNPARGEVQLAFSVPSPLAARVEVVNALGQRVAVLHDGTAAGTLALSLDTRRLAPGVYTVRAAAGGETRTLRLTVVR